MNAAELKNQITWDEKLTQGQTCIVRWTNSYNQYETKAKIIKINKASVRVILLEALKGYPQGHIIVVPRVMCQGWSCNNCITPHEKEGVII